MIFPSGCKVRDRRSGRTGTVAGPAGTLDVYYVRWTDATDSERLDTVMGCDLEEHQGGEGES